MRPTPTNARRRFLRASAPAGVLSVALAAGLLKPTVAHAWLPFFNLQPPAQPGAQSAYPALTAAPARIKSPLDRLLDELRQAQPETSAAVDILSPEIAVDGASIMLEFQALLPEVDGLAVFIEGNPKPLAAAFYLAPNTLPEMRLLVRLAQSSAIAVVARSQGKFYRNFKEVKVTQGGCSDSFAEAESKHRRDIQNRYRITPSP